MHRWTSDNQASRTLIAELVAGAFLGGGRDLGGRIRIADERPGAAVEHEVRVRLAMDRAAFTTPALNVSDLGVM